LEFAEEEQEIPLKADVAYVNFGLMRSFSEKSLAFYIHLLSES
jgi:hypothetical protein